MTTADREDAVTEAIERRRVLVDDAIDELMPDGRPGRLYDASRTLLDAGGKRLRPSLVLLVAESLIDAEPFSADYRSFPTLDDGEVDVMRAAVAVELVHTFTLIHDDIMDDDELRRGVPAVHREFDEATAILAGDTLYSIAFEMLLDAAAEPDRVVDAARLLANACTRLCEGQALDLAFETRSDVLPDEYLEMVELKTAVLYATAAGVPALLLGADEETVDALYRYGMVVGQAFQIQDDVLDLTVPSETLGKRRGSDLVENKGTIITLHARERGVDVHGLVGDDPRAVTDAEIDAAVDRLHDVGSIDYARDMAQELVAEGKAYLEVLPDNEARRLLAMLADYLIERGY